MSVHLVEVSPVLSRLQAQSLTGNSSQEADSEDEPVYRHGETAAGLPVSWYRRLDDVPAGTDTNVHTPESQSTHVLIVLKSLMILV